MYNLKKLKAEGKNLASLFLGLILTGYFILGKNIQLKLLLGGVFFLFHAFISRKENKFSALFEGIAGVMALLTLLLPKQPLWYIVIFYSLVLLILFGFLYIHRKMRSVILKENVKIIYV